MSVSGQFCASDALFIQLLTAVRKLCVVGRRHTMSNECCPVIRLRGEAGSHQTLPTRNRVVKQQLTSRAAFIGHCVSVSNDTQFRQLFLVV